MRILPFTKNLPIWGVLYIVLKVVIFQLSRCARREKCYDESKEIRGLGTVFRGDPGAPCATRPLRQALPQGSPRGWYENSLDLSRLNLPYLPRLDCRRLRPFPRRRIESVVAPLPDTLFIRPIAPVRAGA